MLIAAPSRLTRWQLVTGAALLVGYGGYYICRSNLSVVVPALIADPSAGVDRASIGLISSAGIVAYAAGKSITGVAGDFLGGRTLFLGGLFLSVVATLAFSASAGLPLFLLFWMVNRFVQSAGWAGLTKTAAHWYPARRYGTVMSLLSLSFLFGDAAGRYVLGGLLAGGTTWRGVFVAAACVLGVIGLLDVLTLRGTPRDVGLPEPPVSAENIFGTSGSASTPDGLADLLKPYLVSLSFWMVCGLSFGMTLIREAFNTWTPTYLVDAHHLTQGTAAQYSALFPLLGGVSSIAVGVSSDNLRGGNRVKLVVPAMALCALSLIALAIGTAREDLTISMLAIGSTAFCLLGPYTLLAGAIAMDLGGRKGSATAAGLIDTAGYVGGTLSGFAVGRLAETGGWASVFNVMAALAGGVAVIAAGYCLEHRRRLSVNRKLRACEDPVSETHSADMTDRILKVLAEGGAASYFGEPVTQLDHALQTAALAERADAPEALVVAALLHDIGHLLEPAADGADRDGDARHEEVGNRWLAGHFGRAVTEPIRLHVAAKRYLCTVEAEYAASLSGPSLESFTLQGGPLTVQQVRVFEQTPWAKDAAALRRWDDAAKVPGLAVPGLSHYRSRIERLLERR